MRCMDGVGGRASYSSHASQYTSVAVRGPMMSPCPSMIGVTWLESMCSVMWPAWARLSRLSLYSNTARVSVEAIAAVPSPHGVHTAMSAGRSAAIRACPYHVSNWVRMTLKSLHGAKGIENLAMCAPT